MAHDKHIANEREETARLMRFHIKFPPALAEDLELLATQKDCSASTLVTDAWAQHHAIVKGWTDMSAVPGPLVSFAQVMRGASDPGLPGGRLVGRTIFLSSDVSDAAVQEANRLEIETEALLVYCCAKLLVKPGEPTVFDIAPTPGRK